MKSKLTSLLFSITLLTVIPMGETYAGKEPLSLPYIMQISPINGHILEFLNFTEAARLAQVNQSLKKQVETAIFPQKEMHFLQKLDSFEYLNSFWLSAEKSEKILNLLFEKQNLSFSKIYQNLTSIHPLIIEVSDLYPSLHSDQWHNFLQNFSLSKIYLMGSPFLLNQLGFPNQTRCIDIDIPYDFSDINGVFQLNQTLKQKALPHASISLSIDCSAFSQQNEEIQQKVLEALLLFPQCHSLALKDKCGIASPLFKKILQNLDSVLSCMPSLKYFRCIGYSFCSEDLVYLLRIFQIKSPHLQAIELPHQRMDMGNLFEEALGILTQMPCLKSVEFSQESVMERLTFTGFEHLISQLALEVDSCEALAELSAHLKRYPNLNCLKLSICQYVSDHAEQVQLFATSLAELSALRILRIQTSKSDLLVNLALKIPAYIQRIEFFLNARTNIKEKAQQQLTKWLRQRFQHPSQRHIPYTSYFFDGHPLVKSDRILHFLSTITPWEKLVQSTDEALAFEKTKHVKKLMLITVSPEIAYCFIEKMPPYVDAVDIVLEKDEDLELEDDVFSTHLATVTKNIQNKLLMKHQSAPLEPLPCCILNQRQIYPIPPSNP